MYAIIATGGKQYKVCEKDILEVEKLNAEVGAKVEFEALMTSNDGKADFTSKKVVAEVLAHGKGEKVTIAVYKKKNTHQKTQGHRQPFTKIKIISIGK